MAGESGRRQLCNACATALRADERAVAEERKTLTVVYREHGLVVDLGLVEAVQEVDRLAEADTFGEPDCTLAAPVRD
ncbi:MAG: hypothetical protein ACJ734_07870 [Gaiellaceae bacterium]